MPKSHSRGCHYFVFLDVDHADKSGHRLFTTFVTLYLISALSYFRIAFLPTLTANLFPPPPQLKHHIPQLSKHLQKQKLLISGWHYLHRALESKLYEGRDFLSFFFILILFIMYCITYLYYKLKPLLPTSVY